MVSPPHAALAGEQGQDRPSAALAAGAIDQATIEELRSLLGPARLGQLFDLFAAELDARPAAIRSALADRDPAAAAAEAHSLEGAAANLGAMAVRDAARALAEAMGEATIGNENRLAAALHHLAAQTKAAREAIAAARS